MAESNPTQPPPSVPEERIDALYGLPLEEFTPRRDELAKELRAAGSRDAAAWVKALRKPTAAAWLVNQLARTQRADARRMLESGDALRAAQDSILAGSGSAGELARASVEHDEAMRRLIAKAPGLLNREGVAPSGATLDRAAETLRAIALDDEARDGFASGRLARERRASGLGFTTAAGPTPTPKKKPAKAEPDRTAERQREQARAAVEAAKARRRAAREAVADLERELRTAEREWQSAQRRVDKIAASLTRAREKEARARAQLDEAQAAAKRK